MEMLGDEVEELCGRRRRDKRAAHDERFAVEQITPEPVHHTDEAGVVHGEELSLSEKDARLRQDPQGKIIGTTRSRNLTLPAAGHSVQNDLAEDQGLTLAPEPALESGPDEQVLSYGGERKKLTSFERGGTAPAAESRERVNRDVVLRAGVEESELHAASQSRGRCPLPRSTPGADGVPHRGAAPSHAQRIPAAGERVSGRA